MGTKSSTRSLTNCMRSLSPVMMVTLRDFFFWRALVVREAIRSSAS